MMLRFLGSIVDYSMLPRQAGDTRQIILNMVFGLSASIALLMIVISGFRYIVANGDPNSTANAKKGIVYALVGLVVVMAAYSIVTFVVNRVT